MQRIYQEIREPVVSSIDFDNVVHDEPEYDEKLGMPGLHKVKSKVEYQKRESTILLISSQSMRIRSFWRNSDLNRKNALVL